MCVGCCFQAVLFIVTFIWSNCFLTPTTFSLQITYILDFLSKTKPTTLLRKQSVSTSDHFSRFPLKTKPQVVFRGVSRWGCPCPWEMSSCFSRQAVGWVSFPDLYSLCTHSLHCCFSPLKVLPANSKHRMNSRAFVRFTQRPMWALRFSLTWVL